jgi:hypothetical protein
MTQGLNGSYHMGAQKGAEGASISLQIFSSGILTPGHSGSMASLNKLELSGDTVQCVLGTRPVIGNGDQVRQQEVSVVV